MSITHAILGILSWKSVTGYDLKKIIQDSPFMYWSANNNQIYKSLVQLLDEGFVTCEVQHQESSPSKKIYTITEEGLAELKDWVVSTPEPPDLKKSFLIQLAWADQLNTDELNALLTKYEEEVRTQVLLQKEKKLRGPFSPGRTAREIYLWDMIYDNVIDFYKREWEWIQKLRNELRIPMEKEVNQLKVQVVDRGTKKYVECASAETTLRTGQDALDLIAACFENDTNLLMLHAEALSDDFFNLRTGLAGEMLQKFMNYRVKAALIITNERVVKGRFKELLTEANKGNDFRVFGSAGEAEEWLLNFS
ncbi:DUF4180 domain-containing protein [Paenibacillus ehimensis]|uniref:DUF4180 domain-containing protein n=1 Tax=Paenibacillus ehimensis TaxID=79264 RepID=A0ABT8VKS7_9BACL|nr:DUF4180 domain-containing protein [Paenibacillus ehimensis]MDO3681546.1 DUF4180 domain-containing protein [Paenibacillus ehimensis]